MTETVTGLNDFRELLKVQALDTEMDQLRHHREHLAGHEALVSIQQRAVGLRPRLTVATAARDEVSGRLRKIEAEVETIEARVAKINSRLYDGSANIASSDALAMSQEVGHLNDRRRVLEDHELQAMEELEPLQADVETLETAAHTLAREMAGTQAVIADEQRDIDQAIASKSAERVVISKSVPATLLTQYEVLRGKLGGIAAAPLVGNSCGGCHLSLSATEVARIHKSPETDVLFCDECGRILVR